VVLSLVLKPENCAQKRINEFFFPQMALFLNDFFTEAFCCLNFAILFFMRVESTLYHDDIKKN
jgi:hypothetical protein